MWRSIGIRGANTLRRCVSTKSSLAAQELEVLRAIRGIKEPSSRKSLQSLGCIEGVFVKANGNVNMRLNMFVPGYPFLGEIKQALSSALASLPWFTSLTVEVGKSVPTSPSTTATESGLHSVCHVVGVSSCKGGVGKSTVAVNLACALAQRGLNVGIFDADVFGPSLPSLLEAQDLAVRRSPSNPKFVLPLHAQAIPSLKMLSFGHVNPKAGAPGAGGREAAVMRGPMVTKVLNQLLLSTDWGELDYLIVDMPPGTGDAQLTLTQSVSMSGAVVVTTPHRLALVDAAKGVSMFEQVEVPVLSVVENMAYFRGRDGHVYYPFGRGGQDKLLNALALQKKQAGSSSSSPGSEDDVQQFSYHTLPLTPEGAGLSVDGEEQSNGLPAVLGMPDSETAHEFVRLGESMILQLFHQKIDGALVPMVLIDQEGAGLRLRYYQQNVSKDCRIPADVLRHVDPVTGEQRTKVPTECKIERVEVKGRYGVGITWSDGPVEIYKFDALREVAAEHGL